MFKRPLGFLFAFLTAPIVVGDQAETTATYQLEPIQPLPVSVDEAPAKVALGRKLFHEPRLSKGNTISCASCHPLDNAGTDGLARSLGVNGAVGNINTPTVLNSGLNIMQFWDGRAKNLEEQVEGPIHNPKEMASNWREITAKLSKDPDYVEAFTKAYGGIITATTIKSAIATFERTLITPNAPFDKFLRGDEGAITAEEKEGYLLFKSYGCASCHQGQLAGGNMFQKMGVFEDYFAERGNITKVDYGRFNVTDRESHRFMFKVPSLRNIALTAPYFHDGSAKTLEEAVSVMARYQLGRFLSAEHLSLITGFLRTLSGELPEAPQ